MWFSTCYLQILGCVRIWEHVKVLLSAFLGVIVYSIYLEGTWFYTIWLIDILVKQPLFWGTLPKDHKQENLSSAAHPVGESQLSISSFWGALSTIKKWERVHNPWV